MKTSNKLAHPRLKFVDHGESYGRHLLKDLVHQVFPNPNASFTSLDIGCGSGADLQIVKAVVPHAKLLGVEFSDWNHNNLRQLGIESLIANIEYEILPIANESIDLVIANQVFEHTKEIFWINHEIFRVLKVGGYLYLGVPNVLALHNRILALAGRHPTSIQAASAHVRGFSKRDTIKLYEQIGRGFCNIEQFCGAQFYPFPPSIARPLANAFPSLAVAIFFMIRKTSTYQGEVITWLAKQNLETNFYRGLAT